MTTSLDIQRAVVGAAGGNTAAGARVYTSGTFPDWDGVYPYILVMPAKEQKQSLAKGQVAFLTTTTLRLVLRSQNPVTRLDDGLATAEDMAWEMYRDLFGAIINSTDMWRLIQDTPQVQAQVGVNPTGEQLIGEVVAAIAFEYPQGPEDFYQPASVAIAGFDRVTG